MWKRWKIAESNKIVQLLKIRGASELKRARATVVISGVENARGPFVEDVAVLVFFVFRRSFSFLFFSIFCSKAKKCFQLFVNKYVWACLLMV